MIKITAKQKQVLQYIICYKKTHGYPPTLRETAKTFGLASPESAKRHIAALVKKGYLIPANRKIRALTVTYSGCFRAGVTVYSLPIGVKYYRIDGLTWRLIR